MSRRPATITQADVAPMLLLSRAKLARALDVSESTVDELVRRGVMPRPIKLGGCVRWSLSMVEEAIASLSGTSDNTAADPYMAGVNDAAKAIEGRRGAS